ncbi:LysM peptidoglycan-binding domain-containing protein [Shewanella avicenniae]|uniref:LysM peptidoglycan-binding domain-containing protein n=1 Tax=Shewanella avicenniae TaxID=2814294 RepID=A0ABX7QXS0_9GAMM|nr:LysM peptidoglycan-binding domain-containing protein [Shewanella avicenniae]
MLAFLSGCQVSPQFISDSDNIDPDIVAEVNSQPETPEPTTPQQAPQVVEITDVWQRLRLQLNIPVPEQALVERYREWYLANPKHLAQISERAGPFLYLIVDAIEKRGLPMELALLPIVESAFDPFAYSPGAASGLWQFTSPMARHFGLKINWWYDGRRDVPAATTAALDMMQYLYQKTGENWLYAIAAYNSGEGRILNAIKRNEAAGKPTDFWSLSLPSETERYVPQLLALADVIKHADQYGIQLAAIDNKPAVHVVDIGSQIDLAKAASLAEIDITDLQQLNPGYNHWATAPKGPHKLVLPVDKAEEFSAALAALPAEERLNWVRYQIRRGDSLGLIAKKHRTTVDIIRSINNIKGNNIVAGKHLLIPIAQQDATDYPLSAEQRVLAQQNRNSSRYSSKYQVKSGDSLWKIARQFKISTSELANWNGLSAKDTLKPGKTLVIWHQDDNRKGVVRTVKYKVRNGDSLAAIASKFKVSVSQLRKWNQLNEKKYLQPGQMLTLYVDVTSSNS